ncbi:hypothetical protein PHLGIDRAFT_379245 [Phlebiopsis gigantea 11061_1 CR5-6]|uniref:Uncharacterized protein n=1 Tax=Phlebiopsis gigantea (strain 11061_1 CR5-6) TaxID=745531 RepID=A0A0C3PNS9_PHLG1|nr:hypothetical protein PHLGIDRAFT_379245 [Phlebiopsis gigantea 11061_1 CR5-6]
MSSLHKPGFMHKGHRRALLTLRAKPLVQLDRARRCTGIIGLTPEIMNWFSYENSRSWGMGETVPDINTLRESLSRSTTRDAANPIDPPSESPTPHGETAEILEAQEGPLDDEWNLEFLPTYDELAPPPPSYAELGQQPQLQ